jgi:hypothetical protein
MATQIGLPYRPPLPVIGLEGDPLKEKQIYYCITIHYGPTNKPCPDYKRIVESWLTPAEAAQLLSGPLKCKQCGRALKWVRSESVR